MTAERGLALTRPVIGIENRTATEVFDIMSDRIRAYLTATESAARLTEAQMRALSRMESGNEVWTTGGLNSCAFWYTGAPEKAPRLDTLHVLERKGFIRDHETERWKGRKYRITEAGRRALSESRP